MKNCDFIQCPELSPSYWIMGSNRLIARGSESFPLHIYLTKCSSLYLYKKKHLKELKTSQTRCYKYNKARCNPNILSKISLKLFDPLTSSLPSKLCSDTNQRNFILHFLKPQLDTIFHKSSIV